jgi:hypothetical protein
MRCKRRRVKGDRAEFHLRHFLLRIIQLCIFFFKKKKKKRNKKVIDRKKKKKGYMYQHLK